MIEYQKLKIGDRLIRTKGGILSKHHAIYAGFWNEEHLIAENQNNIGVQYISLEQFLSEGTITRVEYNKLDENSQSKVLDRINKKIGKGYNLLNYNCEHFANEILTGISESKQIKAATAIGIGVMLCLLAFTKISNSDKNK